MPQIYFLDRDPMLAAQYHMDTHCSTMIVEHAVLLSTVHRLLDGNQHGTLPDSRDKVLYQTRVQYKDHPVTDWVKSNVDNYRWLHDHLHFLIGEYRYRYGNMPHAAERLLPYLLDAPYNIHIDDIADLPIIDMLVDTPYDLLPMIPPPQCVPEECKREDFVEAYRDYYINKLGHLGSWVIRGKPPWWQDGVWQYDQ